MKLNKELRLDELHRKIFDCVGRMGLIAKYENHLSLTIGLYKT